MRKWLKLKLLVMLLPVLAVLMALPFWGVSSTAHADSNSIASGSVPWDNANAHGVGAPFQMAAISSVFSGTLICPNMVQSVPGHGIPTLQVWLIEDSPHTGRLDASGETRCTQAQTPWSLSAGQNPAGQYHIWLNCHWGGCGNDVKLTYNVDTSAATPAGNTLTADQLLNQTLGNQTPKPAQANTIHTGWATSASPATSSFPSSSIQSKIAADAVIACTNPAGTLRMSIKISPTSSLNPNEILNSTTLSCQSGSGHTDDLSVSTDMGFIVTFDNAINTGNWAVKYVASADKPLPTPPSPTNPPTSPTNPSPPNPNQNPCVSNNCNPGGPTRTVPATPFDACVAGMDHFLSGPARKDIALDCDTSNKNSSTYDACTWGYLGGDPTTYGSAAKHDADTFCAGYYPPAQTTPLAQTTVQYCKDGINGGGQGIIQAAGIPVNASTDCSYASSPGSLNDCIAGYVLDDWQKDDLNETFTEQVNKLKQDATTIGPCSSYSG